MKIKNAVPALLALAMVLALAPAASANCAPSKEFGTWDFTDYIYYYVNNYSGDLGQTVGAFWEPGSRATANEGTYPIDNWLKFYPGTGQWYVSGSTGDSRVEGCMNGEQILVVSEATPAGANMFIGQANETPTKASHFNYTNLTFAPIPRPRVVNRSRVGDIVTLDLQTDGLEASFSSRFGRLASEYITGLNIYTFTGTDDPGRDAALWTAARTDVSDGSLTNISGLDVDCSNVAADVFIAVGVQVTGEYDTVHLSTATVVECDPTLADPDDKFDLIRDRGRGQKKGRPFTDR